jgi:peptidyl-prolyl cis-trans isomerase SurA
MTFFNYPKSAALLLFSAALSAAPAFAQTPNAKTPPVEITPPVTGKVVEDIVARVNDQIITQSEYDRAAAQMDGEAKQQAIPARELQQKQADLLRDLIDQQLLLSKGKELGITGETELIKRLDEIRKQNHLESLEDLEKAAAQQGVSYEDFKATIRNGIITQQVVRDEVGRHITMSPTEAQRYFTAHEAEFALPESVTLNEILIPTPGKTATDPPDAAEVQAAQTQADAIVTKLASGAKFEDQAKAAPTDPTAPRSVVLGDFKRGMLAKEIEDKAFALNAGQYTQPIRTKQGFIILQVTQHTPGGEASFKQVEPQVEEALFMERMQPALRQYLTKLREEAYVELKPGVVDTGSSGNEMRLSYSAYTPPSPKKKKKFARARFRGKTRGELQTAAATPAPAAGTAAATPAIAASTATAAAPAVAKPAAPRQQASNSDTGIEKPGKREKIRFGQAPRESLPSSSAQVATAVTPDNGPATPTVTTPESRFINPDGTISGEAPAAPERKSRLSSRPKVKKVKGDKSADAPPEETPDEKASEKVQDAPLGLDPTVNQKKPKVKPTEKTRIEERPKAPDATPAPYLGQQPAPAAGSTAPATTPPPATQ